MREITDKALIRMGYAVGLMEPTNSGDASSAAICDLLAFRRQLQRKVGGEHGLGPAESFGHAGVPGFRVALDSKVGKRRLNTNAKQLFDLITIDDAVQGVPAPRAKPRKINA